MEIEVPKKYKELKIEDVPIDESVKKYLMKKDLVTVGDAIDAAYYGTPKLQKSKFNVLKLWVFYQMFDVRIRDD